MTIRDVNNLNDEDYESLPLSFQRKYIKKRKYSYGLKRKSMAYRYSKKVLKNRYPISFVDPSDKTIAKKIDYKEYIIQAHQLYKSYFSGIIETRVLKNLNFKINRGDIVTILGPSGSGKTTLLNILSALDSSTDGDVFVDGINLSILNDRDLTKFRKYKIGFIFQQYNLLPNLNASENIEICSNLAKNRDNKFIEDVINTIGLKKHIKKYPYQLSGGQQQRVSIARALAKKPEILFCDEPTGALDLKTGNIVLNVLRTINKKFGTTIIIVTHNPDICKYSNTIIHVGEGKIISYERDGKKITDLNNHSWY